MYVGDPTLSAFKTTENSLPLETSSGETVRDGISLRKEEKI